MAETETKTQPEETVRFRVTRPNTSVFHPDRAVAQVPVMTGGELDLPKTEAEYHVSNGVGEIVTEEAPEEAPAETPEAVAPVKRSPGRPPKQTA